LDSLKGFRLFSIVTCVRKFKLFVSVVVKQFPGINNISIYTRLVEKIWSEYLTYSLTLHIPSPYIFPHLTYSLTLHIPLPYIFPYLTYSLTLHIPSPYIFPYLTYSLTLHISLHITSPNIFPHLTYSLTLHIPSPYIFPHLTYAITLHIPSPYIFPHLTYARTFCFSSLYKHRWIAQDTSKQQDIVDIWRRQSYYSAKPKWHTSQYNKVGLCVVIWESKPTT